MTGLRIAAIALLVVTAAGPATPTLAATSEPPTSRPSGSPTAAPTTPTPTTPTTPTATLTDTLVLRIGQLRVDAGCRPWRPSGPLQRTARTYAAALSRSGVLSHVDSLGGTAQDRVRREGYRGNVIELLGSRVTDPAAVATDLARWIDLTDLRDCRYRSVGAALDRSYLVVLVGDR